MSPVVILPPMSHSCILGLTGCLGLLRETTRNKVAYPKPLLYSSQFGFSMSSYVPSIISCSAMCRSWARAYAVPGTKMGASLNRASISVDQHPNTTNICHCWTILSAEKHFSHTYLQAAGQLFPIEIKLVSRLTILS